MDLKKRTVTTHFVQYNDLENFIAEVYGVDFSFVADQECGNDSEHRFDVDGVLDKNDLEDFAEFMVASQFAYFKAQLILDKLCADKHIEPGCYVIEVCW